MFVNVKAVFSDKSLATIKATLDDCLIALGELGGSFQVCVFDPSERLPSITSIASIGHHLTHLRRYFSGLVLSTTSWSQWHISWLAPESGSAAYSDTDFLNDVNALVDPLKFVFYRKRLQAPFTTTVGWIFKTHDKTNCEDLHSFLAQELATTGVNAPFAFITKFPLLALPFRIPLHRQLVLLPFTLTQSPDRTRSSISA